MKSVRFYMVMACYIYCAKNKSISFLIFDKKIKCVNKTKITSNFSSDLLYCDKITYIVYNYFTH